MPNLPANGSQTRHTGAIWTIVPHGALQVTEAAAVCFGGLPSLPGLMLVTVVPTAAALTESRREISWQRSRSPCNSLTPEQFAP